ncbi:uncharacterized protein CDV56_108509 [Aspergillus thermomutatus]|uniref:Short-chain dehydrogenase n=1 Tax=Aspergillus thermomutatus TaxID=41047 RepID=A0A397HHD6_ASPTH|nr:uncharacterized protein CDV56_108509 [Aspergillus thermomutatus]RHZ62472.1 hypothetical protein CDV56_108509 [Aspergillus thermomutatus]
MPSIQDSTILIIGGSSGIGYGVAEKCLTEGARVHIASSNKSRVHSSVKSLKEKISNAPISGHVCDLSSRDVEKNLEQLLSTVAPIDHIVFTAGDSLAIMPLDSIDLDMIQRAGHIRWLPEAIPNWSLVAGYLTGLHGLTRNLALDLKPLRVNLVSPGVVVTPLWGQDGVPDEMKNHTTLGKVGTPDEVAEAYVYLMKDTNATGSCISTNAGSLLL